VGRPKLIIGSPNLTIKKILLFNVQIFRLYCLYYLEIN
jgi:hypothetical protein